MSNDLKWFEDNFCLRDILTIKKPLTIKGLYGENYEFNVGETIRIDKLYNRNMLRNLEDTDKYTVLLHGNGMRLFRVNIENFKEFFNTFCENEVARRKTKIVKETVNIF